MKDGTEANMINLHQTPGAWGMPSVSPFCVKLETWLRMAEIPYTVRPGNPFAAPKGKIPYITDGNGSLGDSEMIIAYLKHRYGGQVRSTVGDVGMTREEQAQAHLVRRTLEDSTYWLLVYERWMEPAGWAELTPVFLGFLPPVIGRFALYFIRRGIRNKLQAQGVGRHSPAERLEMARDDITAVATVLGDRDYVLGEVPRSIDAAVYAMLEGVRAFPVDSPTRRLVTDNPRLMAYLDRVKARWYPELRQA